MRRPDRSHTAGFARRWTAILISEGLRRPIDAYSADECAAEPATHLDECPHCDAQLRSATPHAILSIGRAENVALAVPTGLFLSPSPPRLERVYDPRSLE